MEDRWSWLVWLLAAIALAAFVRLEGVQYVPSGERLYTVFIIGAGLVAGVMVPARWKIAWMFGGLALFLAGCAIAWAWSDSLPFGDLFEVRGGPIKHLAAGAYMCFLACAITIVRRAVGLRLG